MATKRFISGKYRYTIRRIKLLPKPLYFSFANEEEGDAYIHQLEGLLAQGIVPQEFLDHQLAIYLHTVIDEYTRTVNIKSDTKDLLYVQIKRLDNFNLDAFTYDWCESWIKAMKQHYRLTPSTIKKHVGALARCMDWALIKGYITINHLRRLPKGYSTYNEMDIKISGVKKLDQSRERRIEEGEEDKIREVLIGRYKSKTKQRFLDPDDPDAMACMFDLALETAMRMREIYTLNRSQIDFTKKTIFLEKTKNGQKRQVPMSSDCIRKLKDYLQQQSCGDYIFPWFTGDNSERGLKKLTTDLSLKWTRVFEHADCVDMGFHDLRHEATSRIYERTSLSDLQIAKVTGHKTLAMLARYANLRGSDLADLLW